MAENIAFRAEADGYSPQEVDAYVGLLHQNYEELLAHYHARVDEITQLSDELKQKSDLIDKKNAELDKRVTKIDEDYTNEALALLSETTKVTARARAQARTKITAMIDQTSLHARRLEDSLAVMKDELDKMYSSVENQL